MCRKLSFLALIIGLAALNAYAGSDDYARLVRISFMDGQVSFMHPNEVDWSAASINMPLQVGDRIYTGVDGRAELEFDDGSVIRLAEKTDIEILSLREDLIQLRLLLGLTTATVRSDVGYEIDTPAAAFNTDGKGIYRFDVAENGESDAIVRRGSLEAANDKFTRRIDSDQVIHVALGETSAPLVSRYDRRDEWDEWNERRNADTMARGSQAYVPEDVNMGVADLDRYGRWVTVADYGPAWVPSYVDPYWSPYWAGRWCYRPIWGWTWVSYEPWGWLPYHYGRWYHTTAFGWCWLPGASYGFHFWSPGLVRFYYGPSWVSWVPLGPGDYYNVNHYHYNSIYAYQLNQLRALQRRSPADVINRGAPGGFRTVQSDQFVSGSFGPHSRVAAANVDQPWARGRMVTDQLTIRPVAQSYAPAPERTGVRPQHGNDRTAVVVRTQPVLNPRENGMQVRRAVPADVPIRGIPNRVPAVRNSEVPDSNARRATPARPSSAPETRNDTIRNVAPRQVQPDRSIDPGKNRGRETSPARPSAPERTVTQPARVPERNVERPARQPERPQAKPPENRPRPKDPPEDYVNSLNSDSSSDSGLGGRRASYYSRGQGWVVSMPASSRGADTVQRQPGTSPSVYQAPQPAREYSVTQPAPQAAPSIQRSWNVTSSFQGQRYSAPAQTGQYWAPGPNRSPAVSPGWSGRVGGYSAPTPGRSGAAGGISRGSSTPGAGLPGGASAAGRPR